VTLCVCPPQRRMQRPVGVCMWRLCPVRGGGPLCSPALCMCVSVAMAVCLRGVVGRGRPLWWACACTLGNVCECAQERMGATGAWAAVAWGRDP
jgi:hypothetical protein